MVMVKLCLSNVDKFLKHRLQFLNMFVELHQPLVDILLTHFY